MHLCNRVDRRSKSQNISELAFSLNRYHNSATPLFYSETQSDISFLIIRDKDNLENIATQIFGKSVESMTYHSSQLEELMFGEKNFLQKNCKIEYRKNVNMHRDDSAIRYYFYIGDDTVDIITSSSS